ncbi:MAG: diacylglycerol kinase family lipid kinase [Acidimicrobiia bacterium]|nr:diacylglycerol kinase family lipid kinase [Acidimicrobiia bacterium]
MRRREEGDAPLRLLLIVNTSASAVTARARVVIRKALSADHDVTTAETSRRGNATRLAQDAAAAGYDAVVVLGGDGTLNEAANGLAGSPTALATLPGGSTNVFARTLGIAQDPVEATGELLSSLARGSRRRIGLGSVNGRYFLFHVGMGFDAAVVSQVERRAALKRYAGHPLFVYAAFSTWFRHYDRSRPRLRVEIPGRPAIDDAYMVICMNSNPYTYMGNIPLNLAPDADLDRGLVVATFRSLEMVLFLGLIASVLRRGSHFRRHRTVDYRPDLTEATVTGHGPFPYQVDGDYLGEAERLAFRHEPDALTVVVPAVP